MVRVYLKSGPSLPGPNLPGPSLLVFLNNVRLLNLFESYHANNISAYNLLLAGSYLINPSNNIMNVLDNE